jgi:hypothetical protein
MFFMVFIINCGLIDKMPTVRYNAQRTGVLSIHGERMGIYKKSRVMVLRTKTMEMHFKNDKLHREDGPAIINRSEPECIRLFWYINNYKITDIKTFIYESTVSEEEIFYNMMLNGWHFSD